MPGGGGGVTLVTNDLCIPCLMRKLDACAILSTLMGLGGISGLPPWFCLFSGVGSGGGGAGLIGFRTESDLADCSVVGGGGAGLIGFNKTRSSEVFVDLF